MKLTVALVAGLACVVRARRALPRPRAGARRAGGAPELRPPGASPRLESAGGHAV
jgi:hypothetical protein